MTIENVNGYIGLVSALLPLASKVILMVGHDDGTTTTIFYLNEASTTFTEERAAIAAWFAAHPKPAVPVAPAA